MSLNTRFQGVLEEQRPSFVTIEGPGRWMRRGTTRKTVELMAMARSIYLMACAEHATPAYEVAFQGVRRVALGNGNAPAEAVTDSIQDEGLRLPRRPRGGLDMDIANALVVAIYAEILSER